MPCHRHLCGFLFHRLVPASPLVLPGLHGRFEPPCAPGRMRREFPDLREHCWRANRLWSGSYFAGSVEGAPISVLRQYIEQLNQLA